MLAAKDVSVRAGAQEDDVALAAGFAGGPVTVGAAGTATVLFVKDATTANIAGGATVTAGGNAVVAARDDTSGTAADGGAAVAVQETAVAVAGSIAVTPLVKDTEASIDSGATVTAHGNGGPVAVPADGIAPAGGSFTSHQVQGVVVAAESTEKVFSLTVDGSLAVGTEPVTFAGAVAGAVSAEVDQSTTRAFVGDAAHVASDKSVSVTAVNAVNLFSADGAVAASVALVSAGLAGGVDVGVVRNTTTAYVGDGAHITAGQDVDVLALADKKVDSFAVSGSGGRSASAGPCRSSPSAAASNRARAKPARR